MATQTRNKRLKMEDALNRLLVKFRVSLTSPTATLWDDLSAAHGYYGNAAIAYIRQCGVFDRNTPLQTIRNALLSLPKGSPLYEIGFVEERFRTELELLKNRITKLIIPSNRYKSTAFHLFRLASQPAPPIDSQYYSNDVPGHYLYHMHSEVKVRSVVDNYHYLLDRILVTHSFISYRNYQQIADYQATYAQVREIYDYWKFGFLQWNPNPDSILAFSDTQLSRITEINYLRTNAESEPEELDFHSELYTARLKLQHYASSAMSTREVLQYALRRLHIDLKPAFLRMQRARAVADKQLLDFNITIEGEISLDDLLTVWNHLKMYVTLYNITQKTILTKPRLKSLPELIMTKETDLATWLDRSIGRSLSAAVLPLLSFNGESSKVDPFFTPIYKPRAYSSVVFISPTFVGGSRASRNAIKVAASRGLPVHVRGDLLESELRSLLSESGYQVIPTSIPIRADGFQTDIDVVATKGDHIFLFQCKARIWPDGPLETRQAFLICQDAAAQVQRVNLYISKFPDRFHQQLAAFHPLSKPIVEYHFSSAVCINFPMFSGLKIDGVPIIDIELLDTILRRRGLTAVFSREATQEIVKTYFATIEPYIPEYVTIEMRKFESDSVAPVPGNDQFKPWIQIDFWFYPSDQDCPPDTLAKALQAPPLFKWQISKPQLVPIEFENITVTIPINRP